MGPSRRGFLALAGAAAGSAALAACGGGTLPAPRTAAAGFGERARGTLRIWCRSATQAGVKVTVDAFEKSQDRVRVELTPVLDGQYVTKLATAIRGRSVPDLVDVDDINSTLFAYRDALTDLTDLIAGLPYADQLSPGHLRLGTRDGRQYAVPHLADTSALWYDRELLQRAGVDPAGLSDFAALLDGARKVHELGGTTGWSIAANSPGILGFVVMPHVWASGDRTVVGDIGAQHADITGSPSVRRTLELYRSLNREGLLQLGAASDAGTTWGADFVAGKVGFFPSNYSSTVLKAAPADVGRIGVTLLPGPDGGAAFFDGGDNLAIPRGAQNASAAWEFTTFALDLPQQQRLPQGGYTPVRGDAATPEFAAKYPLTLPVLRQLGKGYAPPALGYNLLFNQPDSPWIAMFRRAVFGGDVDGALQQGQAGFAHIVEQSQV